MNIYNGIDVLHILNMLLDAQKCGNMILHLPLWSGHKVARVKKNILAEKSRACAGEHGAEKSQEDNHINVFVFVSHSLFIWKYYAQ